MRLCFPVETDSGLDSDVFGHFGSAPFFVVFNTEDETLFTVTNQDLDHIHGQCNPVKALNAQVVDAVIVGGIGPDAIRGLNNKGIRVYRAYKGTIRENIALLEADALLDMTMAHTCGGHGHGCSHNAAAPGENKRGISL